jgi:nitroreductase / dihydropteridine reductase
MELIEKLNWRYATKAMNGQKVPQEKVDKILEAARLAPTSSGLQPFEIIVITNQEIKEQIKPHAWNQPQITDCSHLLVFAAWDNYTEDRINRMFDLTNEIRGFENEGWGGKTTDRCCWECIRKDLLKKTLRMPQNRLISGLVQRLSQRLLKK